MSSKQSKVIALFLLSFSNSLQKLMPKFLLISTIRSETPNCQHLDSYGKEALNLHFAFGLLNYLHE